MEGTRTPTRRQSWTSARLKQICRTLEISEQQAHACWHQLLHRTTVAILEAQRSHIDDALLLIQSFKNGKPGRLADDEAFAKQLQVDVTRYAVVRVGPRSGVNLYPACVECPVANDAMCAAVRRRYELAHTERSVIRLATIMRRTEI